MSEILKEKLEENTSEQKSNKTVENENFSQEQTDENNVANEKDNPENVIAQTDTESTDSQESEVNSTSKTTIETKEKDLNTKENLAEKNSDEEKTNSYNNNSEEDEKIKENSSKTKKIVLISCITAFIVFLLFIMSIILALINNYNDKILSNIYIDEICVENLTREEAIHKLELIVDKKINQIIKIKTGDVEKEIALKDLEINYNLNKYIDEAYTIGRDGNIFQNNYRIFLTMINKTNIPSEVSFNEEKLNAILADFQNEIPNHVQQPIYKRENDKLIIVNGKAGEAIDMEKEKGILIKFLLNLNKDTEALKISTKKEEPQKIELEKIQKEIYVEPKNAYFTKEPYEIHAEVQGVDFAISMDEAKKIIEEEKEEYVIPLKITTPSITVRKLGNDAFPHLLATFSTRYNAGKVNRSNNIILAARAINGIVLMPGETFSYNRAVGQRTAARGYKSAPSYVSGEVVDSIGGGICQVSSTLYNSVLLSNLQVVERHNHCYRPDYVPVCRDATVAWGGVDFKFKNNRNYPIRILANGEGGTVKVDIIGLKTENDFNVRIESFVTGSIAPTTVYTPTNTLAPGVKKVTSAGSNGCYAVGYKILEKNGAIVSKTLISKDKYDAHKRTILVGE